MSNQIKIPWYVKRVKRPKNLTFSPVDLDFPDRNKKPNNRKTNRPQPQPVPELQPETVPVKEFQNQYLHELDTIQTPVPVLIPSLNQNNPTNTPVPQHTGGLGDIKERIPGRSPKPNLGGLSPAVKMPTGEILFKLMEIAPDGKFDNFLKGYNELSLEISWYAMNPFFIYEEPSFDQVAEFFKTHDYKKIKDNDIIEYFENLGVSGKDLTTLPYRIFIFKSGLDTLNALEEIFIPSIQPQNKLKES